MGDNKIEINCKVANIQSRKPLLSCKKFLTGEAGKRNRPLFCPMYTQNDP